MTRRGEGVGQDNPQSRPAAGREGATPALSKSGGRSGEGSRMLATSHSPRRSAMLSGAPQVYTKRRRSPISGLRHSVVLSKKVKDLTRILAVPGQFAG
jgi:hypothetical protein